MSKGLTVGYVRVSHEDQNPQRQLDGVDIDKWFIDKVSGKDLKRPALESLLDFIREGDTLIVHSMDRLARNLDDLRSLVQSLTRRGIVLSFKKEGLVFTGDDSPMSNLLLSVMGAVAEFERSHILERQREGIRLAKEKKLYKGRKPKLSAEQVARLYDVFRAGEKKTKIAQEFNICRETLYRHWRQYKNLSPSDENPVLCR